MTTLVVMVQFAAKWLGYAALATIVVAPFLAAFRGSASAAQRRQAIVAEPAHAMVQTADQRQAVAQVCFVLSGDCGHERTATDDHCCRGF